MQHAVAFLINISFLRSKIILTSFKPPNWQRALCVVGMAGLEPRTLGTEAARARSLFSVTKRCCVRCNTMLRPLQHTVACDATRCVATRCCVRCNTPFRALQHEAEWPAQAPRCRACPRRRAGSMAGRQDPQRTCSQTRAQAAAARCWCGRAAGGCAPAAARRRGGPGPPRLSTTSPRPTPPSLARGGRARPSARRGGVHRTRRSVHHTCITLSDSGPHAGATTHTRHAGAPHHT